MNLCRQMQVRWHATSHKYSVCLLVYVKVETKGKSSCHDRQEARETGNHLVTGCEWGEGEGRQVHGRQSRIISAHPDAMGGGRQSVISGDKGRPEGQSGIISQDRFVVQELRRNQQSRLGNDSARKETLLVLLPNRLAH